MPKPPTFDPSKHLTPAEIERIKFPDGNPVKLRARIEELEATSIKITVGEPPHDPTKQFLAWAVHSHAYGYQREDDEARWCIVQWREEYGKAYWAWSVPGLLTSVRILEYAELPRLDYIAVYANLQAPARRT